VESLQGVTVGELLKENLEDTSLTRAQISGPIGFSLTAYTDQPLNPNMPT
jgi:hypothetical protein